MHSTDIAFKPTEDGWGYNPRYSSSWDRIFAKKNSAKEQPDDEAKPAANEPSAAAAAAAAANPVADDPILNELRNRIVALPAARRRLLLDSIEAS